MISCVSFDELVEITVEPMIEVACAGQALEALAAAVAEADPARPVRLDLGDGIAGAPALQLVVAARRSLEARGAFAGYGPRAAAQLPN